MPPIPFVSNTLSDMPHGKHMRVPDLRLLFRGCDFRDRSQSQHHLSASNNLKSNRLTTIASVVFNCAKARFIPTHTLDPRERLSMEAVRIYIYMHERDGRGAEQGHIRGNLTRAIAWNLSGETMSRLHNHIRDRLFQ